jgi:hypothetical protein
MTTVKKGNKEGNTVSVPFIWNIIEQLMNVIQAPEPTGRGKQRRRKAGTT